VSKLLEAVGFIVGTVSSLVSVYNDFNMRYLDFRPVTGYRCSKW